MLIERGGYTYDDVEHLNDVMQIERASRAMSGMSGVQQIPFASLVGGVEETLDFAIRKGRDLLKLIEAYLHEHTGEKLSGALEELLHRFHKVTLRLASQSSI